MTIFSLTACTKDSVHLATEYEMKAYVKDNFGDATYLRKESREDDKCIIYYFKDNQFGFEYYVGSYVSSTGMDGSTFWYYESKNDNFHSKYNESIINQIGGVQLPDGAYFKLYEYSSDDIFAFVNMSNDVDINATINAVSELSLRLTSVDTRRFLDEKEIIICDANKKWLGRYDIYEKEYKSETLATFEYFNQRAEEIMGIENVSINGSKTMKQSDVPGLGNENIANILGSDYSSVT